ncbi:hypothetical_protein [Candidozyma auris]|uniref:hypothetical_protein n=1 Tax=Candidozyma auris TaxID=498019 RepID=UPI000D2BBDE6|nr:hypothetical_protein [[Candida] auris]QEO21728.1 hypothetical_protein [[Candida] auris]GBL47774.1 hypothetical protein CAJCM15448_00480 [[Candida] auris]
MPARSSDLISPPPFGPSAKGDQAPERGAAGKPGKRQNGTKNGASKASSGRNSSKSVSSRVNSAGVEKSASPPPVAPDSVHQQMNNSILPPITGRDVMALIFVFLLLPQGISCLLLLGYILSGTFRGSAARLIAKASEVIEEKNSRSSVPRVHHVPVLSPERQKRWSYSKEVMVEFLQLFSINSVVMLVLHYTMPQSWPHYLSVLAKSIVASRLVGTYTVGTTTYISVVSGGQQTTTTTTSSSANNNSPFASNTGAQLPNGGALDRPKYSKSSFINSLLGFASVTATDYLIRHWIQHLNVPHLVSDLARFYRGVWHFGVSSESAHASEYLKAFFTKSPFIVTYNYLSRRKDRYYNLGMKKCSGTNLTAFDKFIIYIALRFTNMDDSSVNTLTQVLQEVGTVINYAYLVLCIHVTSLTISPFLQKFFISRDYSRNLDHLSSLTPKIPLYGDRKKPLANPLLSSDSMMVVNVDQPQSFAKPSNSPFVITIDEDIASSETNWAIREDDEIRASNFEVFCLVPPASKAATVSNKTQQNRTLVDRKRTNSGATPNQSTTVVERYFTTAIQPMWSWIAAIKIFFDNAACFNGKPTIKKDCGGEFLEERHAIYNVSVCEIGDTEIICEVNPCSLSASDSFSVFVNSISWYLVKTLTSKNSPRLLLKIEGLQPLCQYEIAFARKDGTCFGSVKVSTTGQTTESGFLDKSVNISPLHTLQGCLLATAESLNELKLRHKKQKKDENKKITDLKKQVESMKAKVEKLHSRAPVEGRGYGKLKGLQYSVMQLENEVQDLQKQLDDTREKNESVNYDLRSEERAMLEQIRTLEAFIEDHEFNTSQLKNDIRAVETERNNVTMKHRKLESKISSRREEIYRLQTEIKSMRKSVLGRYQRRQKRVSERFETILPKVQSASDELAQELNELSSIAQ